MKVSESDILYENGEFWVCNEKHSYQVMRPYGGTASITDSAYEKTPSGLSIAKARCDYLAGRAV